MTMTEDYQAPRPDPPPAPSAPAAINYPKASELSHAYKRKLTAAHLLIRVEQLRVESLGDGQALADGDVADLLEEVATELRR